MREWEGGTEVFGKPSKIAKNEAASQTSNEAYSLYDE